MKKLIVLTTLLTLLFLSCQQPIDNDDDKVDSKKTAEPGDTPGTGENPPVLSNTEVLANLPEIEVQLPKSLTASTQSSSRAIGDVTKLDKKNVKSVKSEGWINLNNEANSNSSKIGLLFLSEIKQYANETLDEGNDLESGEIYALGIRNLYDQTPEYDELPQEMKEYYNFDLGKIKIESSDNKMEIYWKVNWPGYEEEPFRPMHFYFDITNPGEDNSVVKFYAKFLDESMHYYTESKMDTGETVTWSKNYESEINNHIMKKKFYYNEDNNLILFDYYNAVSTYTDDGDGTTYTDTYNDEKIAFGNDNLGGVISMYDTYVEAEFYNGNGELVVEEEGSSENYNYSIYDYDLNLKSILNLSEAPNTFKIKDVYNWDSQETTLFYQLSDSEEWVELTTDNTNCWGYYSFYYSDSENISSLSSPGDRKYDYFDYSWEDTENGYSYIKEFKTTYIVPEASNYFGNEYFLSQKYPLDQLLPLSAEYSEKFELYQKELDSETYDWDEDGEIDYVWYDLEFWLESLTDDEGNTTNNSEFNEDADIKLNGLDQEEFYYWDSATLQSYEVYSYVYRTNEGLLPDFFNFSNESLVTNAKLEIEKIYNQEYNSFLEMDYSNVFTDNFPSPENYNDLD